MVDENSAAEEKENQSPYMLFLLVLVFFITGLLGILFCHILKKKGYRCRTSPEELEPEIKDGSNSDQDNPDDISNEDTVERIVKCIIQNEANAEALKQMLGETEGEVPIGPSLCPHRESQDAGPPHHHTVHLGSAQAPCIHCTRKKRSLLHRMGRSKDSRGKPHPGEVTVFSVGRFRVTHIGKKSSNQGSQDDPNACSETFSSDKDLEEQQETKPKNGISTNWGHGKLEMSQNGPEAVPLAQMKKDAEVKKADTNGLKRLGKVQRYKAKNKGSKDRRSSAPEQTAAQRERIDMLQLRDLEQQKENNTEGERERANKEDSSQEK